MAKKKAQQDAGIPAVQKLITLGMLIFMGYIFFNQEHMSREKDVEPEEVRVKITDTKTGRESFSDLSAGKVLIGRWEIEMAEEAANQSPVIDDQVNITPILDATSEAIDAPMSPLPERE